jgi:Domain of unknown function (DUF4347)/FG-GAP-like repeat
MNNDLLLNLSAPSIDQLPTTATTLVVFDDQVSDLEILYQALLPGSIGFTISSQADGLIEITRLLAETGAKWLSIVAHGEPGVIHLGRSPIDLQQIQSQSQLLQQWGVGAINLYSCEVAKEDIGKNFIYQLSELTGATVAAAVTKTGNDTQGGSWDLTVTTGEIAALIPFAAEILQTYQAILAIFPIVYSTEINYQPGSSPEASSLGDFNNDGNLDLVTTTSSGDNILVAFGDGNGGFSATQNFAVGISPRSVSIGDFNGDGKLDLVTGNSVSGKGGMSILLGNGDGTFGLANSIENIGNYPDSVQVGDFNGDGKSDIVIANYFDSNVSIQLGNGNGTFSPITKFALGSASAPFCLRLGDFNGDGKLDLITANVGTNNVSVLLGNGNGTFQAALNTSTGTSSSPKYMSVGDFNGDGKLDLAIVNNSSFNVSILLGNGNGTFGTATNFVVGATSQSVTVGDFNSDGKLDLATSSTSRGVFVLLGNGNGTFGNATELSISDRPYSVNVGDFNKDGKPDLVTVNLYSPFSIAKSGISVLLNTTPTRRNDFNGDKKTDILWRNTDGTVALWQMNGTAISAANIVLNPGNTWKVVGTSDFNGDGKSDLLWRNDNGAVALWQMNGATILSGSYLNPSIVDNSWKVASTIDFNGDSKSDILWRNTDGTVAIWQMDGANVVSAKVVSSLDNSWKLGGTGDFNGDGKADILWRNDNGSLALWQMDGTAILSGGYLGQTLTVDNNWKIAGVDDFTGDGKADILWRYIDGTVALWQLNDNNTIAANVISVIDNTWKIAGTGDYNGDGKADILWRNNDSSTALWQMNGANIAAAGFLSSSPDNGWQVASL